MRLNLFEKYQIAKFIKWHGRRCEKLNQHVLLAAKQTIGYMLVGLPMRPELFLKGQRIGKMEKNAYLRSARKMAGLTQEPLAI